jgi:hypothetical protein
MTGVAFTLDQSAVLRQAPALFARAPAQPPRNHRARISVNPLRTSSIEIRNMMISVMR